MQKIFLILISLFFTACVGVIEDTNSSKTNSDSRLSSAKFAGIYDGHAISHSKIVVRFKPATHTNNEFSYMAHLNGSPSPAVTVISSEAVIDSGGYINLTIPDLKFNSPYVITIEAMDLVTKRFVASTGSIKIWTMANYVPEFDGIVGLENTAGIDATTSLKAIWNLASTPEISGSEAFNPEHAVSGYNVYWSSSKAELEEVLELEQQHFPDITSYPQTKMASVTLSSAMEYTISNLTPGKTYYAAVRARQSSSPPVYERNVQIISLATYKTAPIEFAGIKNASVPTDVRGFSQINTSWNVCTGCGQYKIYVKPENLDSGSIHPNSDSSYLISTITSAATLSKTVVNASKILPNTTYKVYVLACKDSTCGWDGTTLSSGDVQGRFASITVTTTPPIARFSESNPDFMITSLTQPSGTLGLEKLNLTWAEVDSTSGYYSRVRVYHVLDPEGNVGTISGNANFVQLGTDSSLAFGTPFIDPTSGSLDASNAPTTIKIANLQRDQEYCFLVLPWITGNGLTASQEITLSPTLWPTIKCATPQYIAPDFGSTSLAPTCTPQNNGTGMQIEWTHPEVMNIFSLYEVYYRLNDGAFAFSGANGAWLNGIGTYHQDSLTPNVPYFENQLTIANLTPSTEYTFGVNAYFLPQGELTPIRSIPALNMATVTCSTSDATLEHNGWKHIYSIGPKIDGRDGSTILESISEDVHRTPFPDPINGADNGIVRLQWIDFDIAGTGLQIHDLPGASNGYVVYRMKIENDADAVAALNPSYAKWGDPAFSDKLRFNIVSNADGNFAYSSSTINSINTNPYLIPYDHFTETSSEYTFEFIDHPPVKGKIYYYLVRGVLNNTESDFADPTSVENVLKVIVPFNNEVFIHRWMANLANCEDYGRGIGRTCEDLSGRCVDREHDYRCEFRGMGSTEIGGEQYIDRGAHIITDRFELGLNLSFNKCQLSGVDNSSCIPANGVAVTKVNLPYTTGYDSIAVALDGTSHVGYYSANSADAWTQINSLSTAVLKTGNGAGLGKSLVSNNAYLPPISSLATTRRLAICGSLDGRQFYTGATTFYKKLMGLRDYSFASAWAEPLLLSGEYRNLEIAANYTSHPTGMAKDCFSNLQTNKNAPTAKQLNYTNQAYCKSGSNSCYPMSGTDGNYSSEHCVSRFGLQDMVGGIVESTSDYLNHTLGVITLGESADPANDYMTKLRFDNDTFNMTNHMVSVSTNYLNTVLGFSLNCTGAGGYNSNRLLIGSHQCQEDDMILRENFFASGTAWAGILASATGTYGLTNGGRFTDGANNGRQNIAFNLPYGGDGYQALLTLQGFRCIYEVP